MEIDDVEMETGIIREALNRALFTYLRVMEKKKFESARLAFRRV